jgi:hypothetical protein
LKIVSRQTSYDVYEYAVFDNHVSLFKYIVSRKDEDRIFHEVPLGPLPQKPRFDIDIKKSDLPSGIDNLIEFGTILRDRLISRVTDVLKKDGIELNIQKQLFLTNSHREDKYSSHIIVHGYYHANCDDALGFYEKVVDGDEQLQKYVDRTVYHKGHSLRLLWCRKNDQVVAKTYENRFLFNGIEVEQVVAARTEEMRLLRIFEASLITFVSGCRALPSYAKPKPIYNDIDIPEDICQEMMDLLTNKYGEAPFTVAGVDGSLVKLTRHAPSHCELCDKIHHRMTPFLLISHGMVQLRCGLSVNKKVLLGSLSEKSQAVLYTKNYAVKIIEEVNERSKIDKSCYENKLIEYNLISVPSEKDSDKRVLPPTPFAGKERATPFAGKEKSRVKRRTKIRIVKPPPNETSFDKSLLLELAQRNKTKR